MNKLDKIDSFSYLYVNLEKIGFDIDVRVINKMI